eukprot:CAMPEP_0196570372 /NCGR_PEP_ID=MMETSP1081-20130531/438_1 /TAXON_ID=36882 /ORGANISM="Pyramimonas amylifera, Strain CCMP720" /LENGTH=112 /DNA_ID=CAMNT_0041886773 /DNA_START=123 /DNA_END=461 /DNA_ORIENTATION=+
MPTICEGVEFDTIAREWRLKWDTAENKASLVALQKVLNEFKAEIKAIAGVKYVQRVVCGGCQDFKIIVALSAESFGAWEGDQFAPESKLLAAVEAIPGVKKVETQTYTLLDV